MAGIDRASKKQRELLLYINDFIRNNSYGPSYREIMSALGYKSVSTVAAHVDGLIVKGYLRKTDHSARSIEVVKMTSSASNLNVHEQWLLAEVKRRKQGGLDEAKSRLLDEALMILEITPSDKASQLA